MTSNSTLSLLLFLVVVGNAFQPCDVKVNSVTLYPSTKESFWWDLKETFFTGPLLTYTISPAQPLFQIQKPIAQLQTPTPHIESINRVTAARALTEIRQSAWRNHFVFIEQELDTIDLFYAVAPQGDTAAPPAFTNKIQIISGSQKLQCYSVDYINQDTFLIDCQDSTSLPFVNLMFVVKKSGESTLVENDNANLYTITTKRITQLVTITNSIGREHKYFFRSTPAYATNLSGLDESSLLETYLIDIHDMPVQTPAVLDAATLAYLLGVSDPQYFKFSLIHFEAFPNGRVYVLDAYNGLFVLQLQGNGEWKLIQRILLPPDQAYGFDVDYRLQSDGSTKELIVVLFNDYMMIWEDQEVVASYILNFIVNYPATVAITQEFVVIQNRGITYLYSSEHEEIVHREAIEGARAYLVNPYETEIIGITSVDSRRYTLSHGYLKFPSTNTKTAQISTFQLIATDQDKNQCAVTVNFRVVDSADYAIYDLEELSLPGRIIDYPGPIEIRPLASGPNLDYTQLSLTSNLGNTAVNAKIVNLQELLLQDVSLPNAKDVAFSEVLVLDDNDRKFYLLLQLNNKFTYIYDCELLDKYDNNVKCIDEDQFTARVIFTPNSFVWWTEFDQLYWLVIESDYTASIYTSDEGQSTLVSTIFYTAKAENKITSATVLKNRFYLVLGNRKDIDVYSAIFPFERDHSITEVYVQSLGFTGNWSPKHIYGNRSHNSYLLFIVNEDNVILADFHIDLTIIKVIDCLKSAQISVAVGYDSFFIVQKTTTVNQIQEFDIQNLSDVRLLKTVPLYWYTLQTPLTTDFCSDTGDLFVRAFDSKLQQTVILVYAPMRLGRDSLLKSIPLGSKVDDNKPIHMSSSGSTNQFFYVNTGSLQRVYSFLKKPILQIQPSYDDIQYFTKYVLRFQIKNYADVQAKSYSSNIDLINTQKIIRVDQNALSELDLTAESKKENYIDLGYSWFNGQAIEMDYDCIQCDEYIQIYNPIQRQNYGAFNGYQIVDSAPYLGQRTLFLSSKRVIIAGLDGKQQTSFSIVVSTDKSDTCELVTASQDGKYVFAACYISGNPVIHTSICDTTGQIPECHTFGNAQLLDLTKRVAKLTVIGNTLFVLNANPNNGKQFEGTLNLYDIAYGPSQVTFSNVRLIGSSFFNNQKTTYLSDFYIHQYTVNGKNQLKIFITDISQGLFVMDGVVDNNGAVTYPVAYTILNLYNYLNGEGYFIDSTTQILQVYPSTDPVYSSTEKTLTATVLITCSNVAHYGLKLVFDAANLNLGGQLKSKQVGFVLNQYGNWATLNKLSVGNGYAVIPYTDQARILLALYKLPDIVPGKVPLVRFLGGLLKNFGYPQVNQFIVQVNRATNEAFMYANVEHDSKINENLVITYRLYDNYQLIVLDTTDKVVPQGIVLTPRNTFGQAEGVAQLDITPGPDGKARVKSFLGEVLQ